MSEAQPRIEIDRRAVEAICRRWLITEFSLFGSVLREDFRPDSDVDVIVTFAPAARWTLLDLVELESELTELFGRPVDLVERGAVISSPNHFRRKHILSNTYELYVA